MIWDRDVGSWEYVAVVGKNKSGICAYISWLYHKGVVLIMGACVCNITHPSNLEIGVREGVGDKGLRTI